MLHFLQQFYLFSLSERVVQLYSRTAVQLYSRTVVFYYSEVLRVDITVKPTNKQGD